MAQDALADGFVRLCIDPSLNFFDGKCRILVEGQMISSATTVAEDVPIRVHSTSVIDDWFGSGSILASALNVVFCACPNNIEIHALPRDNPAGGIAAVYTMTIVGTATGPGRFDAFMLNKDMSVGFAVETGDTAAIIATEFVANVPDNFPYNVVNTGGVVTFTAKNTGTIGNHLDIVYNWTGNVTRAPEGIAVSTVRTTPGSGQMTSLDYKSVFGNCCFDVFVLLSDDEGYQTDWEEYLATLWACDKPQCFGHGYTWVSGTPGAILARGSNSAEMSKIAHCPGDPIAPWLEAASYGAVSACIACTNPEISVQGRTYGVLACLGGPQTCVACFTFDEQQELMANAFVVLGPLEGGQGYLTTPYVFNDVTNNLTDEMGRPNPTYRDVNSKRLAAETAVELATFLNQFSGIALFTKNTDIRPGIFGTNPRLLQGAVRTWAKDRIGVRFSEFDDIDNDIVVKTDFEVAPPCTGKPGMLHLNMVYRPPVRIERINANLQPKLLDNCVR